MIKFTFSFLLSVVVSTVFAQTGQIFGRVLDLNSLEPLPFTNVFINQTTIGAAADAQGYYKLNNVPFGQVEVIFSFVGYKTHQVKVDLTNSSSLEINVKLAQDKEMLDNVQVQGTHDKKWDGQLKKFSRIFFGKNQGAALCKIVNPWVLDFKMDNGAFVADASEPIIIENFALGYKVSYFLKVFREKAGAYAIFGNIRFEELDPTIEPELASRWTVNRQRAYEGSQLHLFKSILNSKTKEEGFLLYTDKTGYENSPRSSTFKAELDRSVEKFDPAKIQIVPDAATHGSQLLLTRRLEVHYMNGATNIRTYDDLIAPVSWIDLKERSIKVNANGAVLDPQNIIVSGYLSTLRMADMLPNDYQPIAEKQERIFLETYQRFYEKVYVHTDKPYYYPGERMWFKAYVNYFLQQGRDSLSKTLYVELINPAKKITMEKTLKIDSGFAFNDFFLSDTLREGNYYLRAYTQLQRNFGDENLMMKLVPILKPTDKPIYANQKEEQQSAGLKVTSDRKTYHARDKITLTVELKDVDDNPMVGNVSVSVTDASQVLKIPEGGTIVEKLPIKKEEISEVQKLSYLVDYGVSFKGQFQNDKGKGEQSFLSVVRLEPYQLAFVDTDEHGYFTHRDVQIYDEAAFSIVSSKGKGKPYGRVKLLKRDMPPVTKNYIEPKLEVTDAKAIQRIFSEYEKPADSKMLEEIVVTATRIDQIDKTVNHPYGVVGDYVFDESKIKTQFPNLLYTLQALNVSGLVVNPVTMTVYFERQGKVMMLSAVGAGKLSDDDALEIAKTYTPLVTLDGMPMMGGAGDALMLIDPSTVASIEVTKGQSSIRGTQAPFGVIAVFTKKGMATRSVDTANKNLVKVPGYALTSRFRSPDYENPGKDPSVADYRSTLYWNPMVRIPRSTGMQRVSFFASDLNGAYRVVVEGVDENGEPVRSVTFIDIRQ